MGLADELAKLAELHRAGSLSDDEYAAAKARLIGGQPAEPAAVCPSCRAPLAADAVLCTACGFDRRLGRRRDAADAAPPPPLAGPTVAIACRCGHEFAVSRSFAGMSQKCPACRRRCEVPESAAIDTDAEYRPGRHYSGNPPIFFLIWTVVLMVLSLLGLLGTVALLVLTDLGKSPIGLSLKINVVVLLFWVVTLWCLRGGQAWAWVVIQVAWGLTTIGAVLATLGAPEVLPVTAVQTAIILVCWINLYSAGVKEYCQVG